MVSNGGSVQGIAERARKLREILTPTESSLSGAAEGLGRALTRATSMVKGAPSVSPRDLMARSPLIALAIAAGVGFLVGLASSRR
jgi:ElaB/YqjD/DUF883 family membrane-anchored ribosome-binding protein